MAVAFQDYYQTLGVSREATDKEIKSAYRSLARKWHPDAHQGADKAEAEEKFKQINEAYEVLSDPDKKSKYDRLGANWQTGQDFNPDMNGFHFYSSGGSSDFSDFFESLFGGGGFNFDSGRGSTSSRFSRKPRKQQGQDPEFVLELSLAEAYQGTEKKLRTSFAVF
ncbi:MAG: DnaJ domain-containing protein [Clostridia bacterium]|nr:DnaJ domain-containing protein [Clostridia bacterium]